MSVRKMSKALQIIAEIDRENGGPGLDYTMKLIWNQYDDLDQDIRDAYDELYAEIASFAKSEFIEGI